MPRPHQLSEIRAPNATEGGGPSLARRLLVGLGMRSSLGFLVLGLALAAGCGGGGESCSQLQDDYQNAMPAALACDPSAASQCQQHAMSASSCSCETTVQDATQLNAIVAQMRAKGCIPANTVACPCAAPLPLTCVAGSGGGGTCTAQAPSGG